MLRSCLLILSLIITSCSAPADIRDSRFIMGTLVEFTVTGMDEATATTAISEAANEMQRIEDLFTIYGDHDNSIKQFNRSEIGVPLLLPDEVSKLLNSSLEIKKKSNGAYDPALGKLNMLWGFSQPDSPSLPPGKQEIEAAIPPLHCIEKTEAGWIRSDERCVLDFGAIAKGYAIDRGIETLKQHGIHNAIINAGGDIRLIGRHGDRPWRIGIRHPRNKGEVIKSLELEGDVAVVTSGDYERFYIYGGARYHHILNPESGMPATEVQSSTVMAESAMLADAWSTALFILGNQSPAVIDGINIKSLIIDYKGEIIINTL
ncbi:thiamine biosynthesis lipoprotein [Mariprofundus ferrinatatus]|uniref:FAD:protein FMN transferase n=1 Tax=Mariprofundus ferrinatatus TaxID=1921087 RepID=A0A2K8L3S1_9PROT|nr:FAD:protein FMN transferase [Mariprofundus ferrinatatus]ATX81978.1 thiamine biosynthesis lipoprotein [Mariprofundus ferrinatatus]